MGGSFQEALAGELSRNSMLKLIEKMVLAGPKRKFRLNMDKKEEAILGALESISSVREKAEKLQFTHVVQLYNASQYCLICDLDLSILIFNLTMADTQWRKKLYARLLAMTLVESVEDIAQLLGKRFRDNLDKATTGGDYKQKLNPIVKNLTEFKIKHERALREIRNIAAAHRDQDAKHQLATINKVDPKILTNLAFEFVGLLSPFTKLMTNLMNDMGKQWKLAAKVIDTAFS
ncbi:MAG: hypothetical protein ABSH11_09160 [Verrucomicrobiota bacterium]